MSNKEELYPIHQISKNLAVQGDKLCFTILERYQKMDGKGKSAKPTGEHGWRPRTGGAYFNNVHSLAHGLLRRDQVDAVSEVGLDFDKFTNYIDNKLKEYESFLSEKIVIELGKSTRGKKGVDDSDEE